VGFSRAGEQGSILRLQGRPDDMATEHGHLVAEYDDLDRRIVNVLAPQSVQLENFGEGEAKERKDRRPVSSSSTDSEKS